MTQQDRLKPGQPEVQPPAGSPRPLPAHVVQWADQAPMTDRILQLGKGIAVLDWVKRNQAPHPDLLDIVLTLETVIRIAQDVAAGMADNYRQDQEDDPA